MRLSSWLIFIALLLAIAALGTELVADVWLLIAMVEHSGLRQPLLVLAGSIVLAFMAMYLRDYSDELADREDRRGKRPPNERLRL